VFRAAVAALLAAGVPLGGAACAAVSKPSPASASSPAASPPPLRVAFFYSPTCLDCDEVRAVLPEVQKRWGGQIALERHSTADAEGLELLLTYEKRFGAKVDKPPVIFVGGRRLAGAREILTRLDATIAEELQKRRAAMASPPATTSQPEAEPPPPASSLPPTVRSRFESFTVGAIVLAGLIDGINPCAFTTVVFLLSMLGFLGRSRRDLLVVGAGFSVAVFATYFALGWGLLGAAKTFAVSRGVANGVTIAVGVLALVFGLWSAADAVRCARSGEAQSATLGLPRGLRGRIQRVIREGLSTRSLLAGAIGTGFLVALLESACTGQVYLPVLVLVARTPDLRARAAGWLLLYNAMFIAPLIVVVAAAYWGVGSQRLCGLLRRHLPAVKWLLAMLFVALGVLVLLTV